jgi:hypothetical protein
MKHVDQHGTVNRGTILIKPIVIDSRVNVKIGRKKFIIGINIIATAEPVDVVTAVKDRHQTRILNGATAEELMKWELCDCCKKKGTNLKKEGKVIFQFHARSIPEMRYISSKNLDFCNDCFLHLVMIMKEELVLLLDRIGKIPLKLTAPLEWRTGELTDEDRCAR